MVCNWCSEEQVENQPSQLWCSQSKLIVCGWCSEGQVEDQPSRLWCFQATWMCTAWSEVVCWYRSLMTVVRPPFRNGDDIAGGLCWDVSIRDYSWPLFRHPKLLWDTPTSVFMMSSTILRCNFRVRLHNECMGPSALREDDDGILVYYLWTDLSENWVLGGTSMVRLSWNLPLIQ